MKHLNKEQSQALLNLGILNIPYERKKALSGQYQEYFAMIITQKNLDELKEKTQFPFAQAPFFHHFNEKTKEDKSGYVIPTLLGKKLEILSHYEANEAFEKQMNLWYEQFALLIHAEKEKNLTAKQQEAIRTQLSDFDYQLQKELYWPYIHHDILEKDFWKSFKHSHDIKNNQKNAKKVAKILLPCFENLDDFLAFDNFFQFESYQGSLIYLSQELLWLKALHAFVDDNYLNHIPQYFSFNFNKTRSESLQLELLKGFKKIRIDVILPFLRKQQQENEHVKVLDVIEKWLIEYQIHTEKKDMFLEQRETIYYEFSFVFNLSVLREKSKNNQFIFNQLIDTLEACLQENYDVSIHKSEHLLIKIKTLNASEKEQIIKDVKEMCSLMVNDTFLNMPHEAVIKSYTKEYTNVNGSFLKLFKDTLNRIRLYEKLHTHLDEKEKQEGRGRKKI